jgi:GNAT superfamily N-acetyltransferase
MELRGQITYNVFVRCNILRFQLGISMNSINDVSNITSGFSGVNRDTVQNPGKYPVRIKELAERDRRCLLMHFLALNDEDRLLRFGTVLNDELITRYVQRMNLSRDAVFGVYDSNFMLVGVGHLAFAPREALPFAEEVTMKGRIAEFGVSVLASARGLGIGSKLFERAAVHCRNADIDTLYMHCLASNQTMIHIATKAGMKIHYLHSEANACLKIL